MGLAYQVPGKVRRFPDLDLVKQVISATGHQSILMLEGNHEGAEDVFVHAYFKQTADVTVGTTVPDASFIIPAGDGTKRGARTPDQFYPIGAKGLDPEGLVIACTSEFNGIGGPTSPTGTAYVHLVTAPT